MAEREVTIKKDERANGDWSIYVREGSFWNYTGLTFTNINTAKRMVAKITELWAKR